MSDHAARYLSARKLDASSTNRALADRAVSRAGRLAEIGAHCIPGVLRVETVETGGPDHMAPGCIFARVWLDAPGYTWAMEAKRAREQLEALAAQSNLVLMVALYRVTAADRRRERWAWRLRGLLPW